MKNLLLTIILLTTTFSFSQTYTGQIITNTNDTIPANILIPPNLFPIKKLLAMQKMITVISNNLKKDYYPKDIKSFSIKFDSDGSTKIFDVYHGIFEQRLYANKARLYLKLNWEDVQYTSPYSTSGGISKQYDIQRPDGKTFTVFYNPMGISRIIAKKELLAKFADCQVTVDKITNDVIKVKNESKLIELIIDYEKNCFQ